MSDALLLCGSVPAGVALSVVMFGGLWWTLRRLPSAHRPALFALASFWMRLGVTVFGFYLVTAGDWRRGVAALLGFLIGRSVLVRRIGPWRSAAGVEGA
jgi:F1F0 ATPase subunit 2